MDANTNPNKLVFNVKGVEFTMCLVEHGSFMMGATPEQGNNFRRDELPIHNVTITKDYYIGQTVVTQALWKAIMNDNPSQFKGKNLPVERVFREEIDSFIQKLNNTIREGRFSLPTEAEWEFAARGGNKSQGFRYAGSNNPDEVAWYGEKEEDDDYNDEDAKGRVNIIFGFFKILIISFLCKTLLVYAAIPFIWIISFFSWLFTGDFWDPLEEKPPYSTHRVMKKKPNELDLYDMSGNVAEWCADRYNKYKSEPAKNPQNNHPFSKKGFYSYVLRGGCCTSKLLDIRVSSRKDGGYYSVTCFGFRLCFHPQIQ